LLFVGIDEERRLAYCDDLPDFSIDAIIPAARKAWFLVKTELLRLLATLPNRPASSVRSWGVICSWKSDMAEKLDIKVEHWEVRKPDDLERVFAMAAGSEAVLVQSLAVTFTQRGQIVELTSRHRLPTVWEAGDFVVAGG
jgi:hypothetical protein